MQRLSHLIISDLDTLFKQQAKQSKMTWRSKQNTYHVVNKNIAPSKLLMEVDERGDAFRGIPKLWLFGVLGLSWGCHGHPQAYSLDTPCSIIHHKNSPKTWKLHNTKLKVENSWAPLAKENIKPLQGTVMNSFFIYIGVKPTVFQLLYGLQTI